MPEESTTPDLVEPARQLTEAGNRRDLDRIMDVYALDAVRELSPMGMGTFKGHASFRGFLEDWFGAYEQFEMRTGEILDLGNGVTLAVIFQKGRPVGSSGEVQLRYAAVNMWEDGKIVRTTNYTDIDEGRAAAERLAKERG
jgi:ketosteroid isomerase-like protein